MHAWRFPNERCRAGSLRPAAFVRRTGAQCRIDIARRQPGIGAMGWTRHGDRRRQRDRPLRGTLNVPAWQLP
ncbi:hypothetical protein [Sphingomonas hankookensis]|uniref:hypothetical protein n=1 Tax=Sphingomonas hankookensis TaxID=563996 RepID=UPI003F792B7E